MRGRKGIRTKEMVSIAKERIKILFSLAEGEAGQRNFKRADRYVSLARKIGMRYNVRLPREFRLRICKQCDSYLMPSLTCRVRLQNRRISTTCLKCGRVMRRPLLREKKARKGYRIET